ncbi:MAG: glycosyltransferase family 2 protein [Candidatus Hydrothermae bacterium]|nr:glycosyltransferase family 2 protein [Candidatus Hydrothermae bacterium]
MRILIVIPAFNEMPQIGELLGMLLKRIDRRDILLVDDGSSDGTGDVAASMGVRVLRNENNLGKGISLKKGFEVALREGYDGVITMDADLQHDVDDLPSIMAMARKGYDMVIGSRWKDMSGMPFDRYFTNRLTTFILSLLSGKRLEDTQSGYRYISSRVLREVDVSSSKYDFESEYVLKAAIEGYSIGFAPIKTIYGAEKSHINKVRDTLRFVRLTLKYLWR